MAIKIFIIYFIGMYLLYRIAFGAYYLISARKIAMLKKLEELKGQK